jgi:predicted DNA-binding transcriptional regulator AlpA
MKILRKKTTAERLDVSIRTIDRWARDPKYTHMGFPKLVPLGTNSVGFLEHEVDAFLEQRVELRDRQRSKS